MTNDSRPIAKRRGDLVVRPIEMGQRVMFAVKDPLTRRFFYFEPGEYEILESLDGKKTLADVVAECRRRIKPATVTSAAIESFIEQAGVNGLLVESTTQVSRENRNWLRNPLAIRLPGVNPHRLLNQLAPVFGFAFGPRFIALTGVLVAFASIIVLVNFDQFAQDLSVAASQSGVGWWVMLALVISMTKIIHELGHAVACRRVGGQCQEIGLMFLVGIPCLYCDVSDAWLVRQRWKRIVVSLAGIGCELMLAALATFVWCFATDTALRDVCVTIMLVCSVSTVLFNANPLLRYDGYFVLSDLIAIPNLASQSQALIRQRLRDWVWGRSQSTRPSDSGAPTKTLWAYGVSSSLYRAFVMVAIGLFLNHTGQRVGLGGAVVALFIVGIALGTARWLKPLLSRPREMAGRRNSRPAVVIMMASILLAIIVFTPLPHSLIAPMSIAPSDGRSVFVPVAGNRVSSASVGQLVEEGDLVVTLASAKATLDLLELETEMATLDAEWETLQARRSSEPSVADRIPAIEKQIVGARLRHASLQQHAQRLKVHAPVGGKVFAAQWKPKVVDDDQSQAWIQTPLSPANEGAWLEAGTTLCTIGHPTRRDAFALVGQTEIAQVALGATVKIAAGDQASETTGTVAAISAMPADRLEPRWTATGMINKSLLDAGRLKFYRVRIAIDPGGPVMPVHRLGHVQIDLPRQSIATRVVRWIRRSFQ